MTSYLTSGNGLELIVIFLDSFIVQPCFSSFLDLVLDMVVRYPSPLSTPVANHLICYVISTGDDF